MVSSALASLASLARWLVGLVHSSTHQPHRLRNRSALGVATLQSSATEIVDVAFYYKMCWWLALARKKMWLWIASFGKSYNSDVLQLAEQIFSLSLPQMTKYCVMRVCENIHSWISLVGDLVFSHQGEIYGLNFPKGFLEISFRDLTLLSLLSI